MTPQRIACKSGGVDITAEWFAPSPVGAGKAPLVVLAYGTGGMMAPFADLVREFAAGLARAGHGCLLPDYLARTGTPHTLEMFALLPTHGAAWVAALQDAIAMGVALREVDGSRLAIGGFSLGGNLMLRAAGSTNARAFIDFFAPMTSGLDAHSVVTPATAAALPPTLIHHGDRDAIVPIGDSLALRAWLTSASVACELISYPGQGHPSVHDSASWSARSRADSLATTLRFLGPLLS